MFVHNSAEPNWVSIHCDQKLLTQLVCVKDIAGENNTFNKNSNFVDNRYICTSNAILVNDICYEFYWVSNISSPMFSTKYIHIDIMIFRYIFESIALESKYLSAFVKRKNSILSAVTFVKKLDTVTFEETIAVKGYLIYHSEKYIINLVSHSFECSNGSHILFEYVCDGMLDCPADASDEDSCMCYTSSYSKMCKTMTKNNLFTCSSLYYMTKDGYCLKYTHPERMYKILNIIHDLPIYKARTTSKLIPFDKFENNSAYEGINQRNSAINLKIKQFKCLNPGELPCGRKHYYECFNITSM